MADDDKAAKDAAEKRVKELMKEAISEWQTEQETTRTNAAAEKKRSGSLFDSLFGA